MEPATVTNVTSAPPDTTKPSPLDWSTHSTALRYGGATVLVAVATLLRYTLDRFFGVTTYLVFYPATFLVAMLGGLGPGIAATLLSGTAACFFLERAAWNLARVEMPTWLAWWCLSATGIGISGLSETLERDRKRGSDELRKVSLYTRGLIEAGLDPMITISAEGKITDVNKAAEDATGVARSSLIGTDFAGYFTEPEKARTSYRGSVRPRAGLRLPAGPPARLRAK